MAVGRLGCSQTKSGHWKEAYQTTSPERIKEVGKLPYYVCVSTWDVSWITIYIGNVKAVRTPCADTRGLQLGCSKSGLDLYG